MVILFEVVMAGCSRAEGISIGGTALVVVIFFDVVLGGFSTLGLGAEAKEDDEEEEEEEEEEAAVGIVEVCGSCTCT